MQDDFFIGKDFAFDKLTNVYERDVIVEYVNFLISKNIPFSFAIGDIDNFKYVNDTYGHQIGDKILQEVALKAKDVTSEYGVVGRYGGDEFLFVFPNIVEYDKIWQICHDVCAVLKTCEVEEVDELSITATLGISRFPENEKSYDALFETADKALYRGKTKGRNCFIIYLPEKHANIVVKEGKERTLTSMYIHSMVFRMLTKSKTLEDGIKRLFDFLSSYFMLDHICIQDDKKIVVEKIHNLSREKEFPHIPQEFLTKNINSSTEMFYINDVEDLLKTNQKEFHAVLKKHQTKSIYCAQISCMDKYFGNLRVDSTYPRIWQHGDMDILLTLAKTVSILLYERGLSFDNLNFSI